MSSRASNESAKSGRKPVGEPAEWRVTTPLLLQMHVTECGAACLGSVLAHFGRWVPLTELREKCEVSRDGSTAAGILRAARHYGLECTGRSVELNQIRKLPLPLVLFWEFNHFLILEGFDRGHFYLNDPATGRRKLTVEEFAEGFSSIALQFNPGPDFQRGGDRPSILRQLPLWLAGTRGAIAYIVACGLMLALLALVLPASLSVFVDRVLDDREPWGMLLAGVLAVTAVLVYGLTWLKHRTLKHLAVRLSVVAGNRCVLAIAAAAGGIFQPPARWRADHTCPLDRRHRQAPVRPFSRSPGRICDERRLSGRHAGLRSGVGADRIGSGGFSTGCWCARSRASGSTRAMPWGANRDCSTESAC